MERVRVAVAGLGRVGWQFHMREIAKHEGFQLVAVMDPIPERLQEAQQQYGVNVYTEFQQMLQSEQLDLVVVASPTPFHAEQAITAFREGVDVFLEKPMAISLAEADRIIAAMQEHGRKLMLYQPLRARPEVAAAKYILTSGTIGPVYMIKRTWCGYQRRNDWQALKKFGGGMLSNYGAHAIDQLVYLTEAKAVDVACHAFTVASVGDADDVVKALVRMDNGMVLDLDINMASSIALPSWVLFGKRGAAILKEEGNKPHFLVRYYNEDELAEVPLNEELAAPGRKYITSRDMPWRSQEIPLADFQSAGFNYYDRCYEYFRLNKPPFVPVAESREVMRIMELCRQAM